MTSAPAAQRPGPKLAPKVALVQLDPRAGSVLQKAFEQCGVDTVSLGDDFARRLAREKFEGCVVLLNDQASAVLEAARSSPSNRRMILYGLLSDQVDVRSFSRYGVNALLDSPPDRTAALKVARSTCALLLNEFRRYVRIPLVIEVIVEGPEGKLSGSSREISGGGMSVELIRPPASSDKMRLSFTLPDKRFATIAATICWRNDTLIGFQFQDSDPARQIVKDWISSFLGLD